MAKGSTLGTHADFFIDQHPIGKGNPCFIIAEVAQAHDGSLGSAHAYIDAVAAAGATAIKFQTHLAAEESTPHEPWRIKFSRQDSTRYEYWQRMEFTAEQWQGLAAHARDAGLVFLSSPFSSKAVELLDSLDMPAWKVASGETANLPLLRQMARSKRPVLLSSGMSGWEELDAAVGLVRDAGAPFALFQTTTAYPCPPEKLGLNVLAELRRRYDCPVGLSDHSSTIYASIAAATLGANLLEMHVVFSRECFGPDTSSSVTTAELADLVRGVRFVEAALGSPVDKEAAARELLPLRQTFGKSVVAGRPMTAGTTLTEADLKLKKPGTGIPAAQLERVIGRSLRRPVEVDALISEDDLV